ncbi:MAG TPA: MFS transporter [Thermoleophilaceae bacterium]
MAARLALAVATGAASVLPGFLVGALALQIRSDLDVRVEAVAAGVSVFFLAGALSAGWGGRLADHVGAVRAMRWCVLVTATSLLAGALLAESLVALLPLLALAGVSNAVCQPAINLFVSEQVPADRQGLGFGIKQSGIPAAILVSGLALPVLAIPLGWRATFALCALGPLALGVALRRAGSVHVSRRPASRRPSRVLVLTAIGAALATAGPSALGAYLVASAVDVGIAEGTAGLLAAVSSGLSLAVRVMLGARADRRRDYGLSTVVVLLAAGSLGFALMATDAVPSFVAGTLLAFTLGWGWPGLFNLAVVASNRETPGSASGISQTGIYVGAGGGPAAFGALYASAGHGTAWLVVAGITLIGAAVIWLAARTERRTRALSAG